MTIAGAHRWATWWLARWQSIAACGAVLAACGTGGSAGASAGSGSTGSGSAGSGSASSTRGTPSNQGADHSQWVAAPTIAAALDVITDDIRVAGFGELHQRTQAKAARSALSAFTQDALPVLAPRLSHVVVETWQPSAACGTVAADVTKQVTTLVDRPPQVASELDLLATAITAAGAKPIGMQLTCADFRALQAAAKQNSDDQIVAMLGVTTRELAAQTNAALASYGQSTLAPSTPAPPALAPVTPSATNARRLVVVYGGALHNAAEPTPGIEEWLYPHKLGLDVKRQYVEIDWYPRELAEADRELGGKLPPDRTRLWRYQRGPNSYVIVLPPASPTGAAR